MKVSKIAAVAIAAVLMISTIASFTVKADPPSGWTESCKDGTLRLDGPNGSWVEFPGRC